MKKIKNEVFKQNKIGEYNKTTELLVKLKDGGTIKVDTDGILDKLSDSNIIDNGKKRIWSRLNTETCKIPNKIVTKLKTGNRGCTKTKFSNNGLYLACVSFYESNCQIIIYDASIH